MKKLVILSVLAVLAAGCTATGTTKTTTAANQPLTLEEALQKSAETRQKLQEAKQAYQTARDNSEAAKANNDTIAGQVKAQVKQKVDDTKNQVNTEVQAWKDVLK